MATSIIHRRRSHSYVVALTKLAYLVVLFGLLYIIVECWSFPNIKKFELRGDFVKLDTQQLQQLVRASSAGKNYFTVDLQHLRAQLEALPWVKQAQIERLWPQMVKITITEHQGFAVVNNSAVVSAAGVLFYPAKATIDEGLLSIEAHPQSLPRLLALVKNFRLWAENLQLQIVALKEDSYQTLHVYLSNGWILIFGRSQREEKIKRLLKAYPQLKNSNFFPRIDYVDLRYPDGFAIACRGGQSCQL